MLEEVDPEVNHGSLQNKKRFNSTRKPNKPLSSTKTPTLSSHLLKRAGRPVLLLVALLKLEEAPS